MLYKDIFHKLNQLFRYKMKAIIISDLHLGSRFCLIQDLKRFLEKISEKDELILNGDIIDNPYGKLEIPQRQILDQIVELSFRQNVVWVRGNHDSGLIPRAFGEVRFVNTYSIENRLLITHGADFDEIMPRYQAFMKAFKFMHNLRVKLGAKPVHVANYAKKWRAFYRVLRNNVMLNAVNFAIKSGYEAVTCGHTHYAEDMVVNGIRYINTGSWTEYPTFSLIVTADDMILGIAAAKVA